MLHIATVEGTSKWLLAGDTPCLRGCFKMCVPLAPPVLYPSIITALAEPVAPKTKHFGISKHSLRMNRKEEQRATAENMKHAI